MWGEPRGSRSNFVELNPGLTRNDKSRTKAEISPGTTPRRACATPNRARTTTPDDTSRWASADASDCQV